MKRRFLFGWAWLLVFGSAAVTTLVIFNILPGRGVYSGWLSIVLPSCLACLAPVPLIYYCYRVYRIQEGWVVKHDFQPGVIGPDGTSQKSTVRLHPDDRWTIRICNDRASHKLGRCYERTLRFPTRRIHLDFPEGSDFSPTKPWH